MSGCLLLRMATEYDSAKLRISRERGVWCSRIMNKEYDCPNCGADIEVSEESESATCKCCKWVFAVNRDGEFRDGMWRDLTTLRGVGVVS